MTLFLLFVSTASIMPLAAVTLEASRLGVVGSAVGFCLGAAAGVVQFIGHHELIATILATLGDGRSTVFLVGLYYASILLSGILLAWVTLSIARAVG